MTATIEEAWDDVPNATCTRRGGLAETSPGHADDCNRCAKLRALAQAVLEDVRDVACEFTAEEDCSDAPGCDFCINVGVIRARIEALWR